MPSEGVTHNSALLLKVPFYFVSFSFSFSFLSFSLHLHLVLWHFHFSVKRTHLGLFLVLGVNCR